jgi:hypothetical protein
MAGGTPANPAGLVILSGRRLKAGRDFRCPNGASFGRGSRYASVFRRGRRHKGPPEQSTKGVEDQPFWRAEQLEPDPVHVAPTLALFRQDWQQQRRRHAHLPSPFHGVSTQEVVDALGASFSPVELDWELVGVTFVHAIDVDDAPQSPASAQVRPPRVVQGIGAAIARKRRRKWLREHDQIIASVRDLSWEGYLSLIADIFRREGYEVFVGEGPDSDVIDMEVTRGEERMLVNCQLRGLTQIDAAPLIEMAAVVARNSADGAFIISDGDFAPEAWSMADEQPIVLLDRDVVLGLVLDLTIGVEKEKRFLARLARVFSAIQPSSRHRAS